MTFTTPIRAARRFATVAVLAAGTASSALAQAPTPSPTDFTATSNCVVVRFLGSEAADRSILAYQVGSTFNPAGTFTQLFINNGAGATTPGPTSDFVISGLTPGQNIFFRLINTTQAAVSGQNNFTFYSGPASRNPDNRLHVGLTAGSMATSNAAGCAGAMFTQGFNFEDRHATINPVADFDYNDLRYEIANATTAVIPEPSTYALMATGLLGLAGVASRRRRSNG
jgi:hypothetical protein